MDYTFTGVVDLTLSPNDESGKSIHRETSIHLEIDKRLDKSGYINKDGTPNKEGSKVLTNTFVQGLIANIHYAHENGLRDSAEHLRFIVSELERCFIEQGTIRVGEKKR